MNFGASGYWVPIASDPRVSPLMHGSSSTAATVDRGTPSDAATGAARMQQWAWILGARNERAAAGRLGSGDARAAEGSSHG
jgi:hypothetical protein